MKKKLDAMSGRLKITGSIVNGIKEVSRFPVKVADSCPLAIEQQ